MENSSISLTVKKSTIPGYGIARIHESYFNYLSIESGDNIVVAFGGESIIVKVFGDSLIGKGDIRLRQDDIKKLGTHKRKTVEISRLIPIKETIQIKGGKLFRFKNYINKKRK